MYVSVIPMQCFLKENKLSEFWVLQHLYNKKTFLFSYTLLQVLYNNMWYHINNLNTNKYNKIHRQYTCSIPSIFVVLYETG